MHPIFLGYGPRFKKNYTHTNTVYAVDIYPLIAELAGFEALNCTGSLDRVKGMLRESSFDRTWNLIVGIKEKIDTLMSFEQCLGLFAF